jgi:hypothetical protein
MALPSLQQLLGFGSALLDNVDPNPENFVGAGIIQTKALQVGCLLRLEPNAQAQVSVDVGRLEGRTSRLPVTTRPRVPVPPSSGLPSLSFLHILPIFPLLLSSLPPVSYINFLTCVPCPGLSSLIWLLSF